MAGRNRKDIINATLDMAVTTLTRAGALNAKRHPVTARVDLPPLSPEAIRTLIQNLTYSAKADLGDSKTAAHTSLADLLFSEEEHIAALHQAQQLRRLFDTCLASLADSAQDDISIDALPQQQRTIWLAFLQQLHQDEQYAAAYNATVQASPDDQPDPAAFTTTFKTGVTEQLKGSSKTIKDTLFTAPADQDKTTDAADDAFSTLLELQNNPKAKAVFLRLALQEILTYRKKTDDRTKLSRPTNGFNINVDALLEAGSEFSNLNSILANLVTQLDNALNDDTSGTLEATTAKVHRDAIILGLCAQALARPEDDKTPRRTVSLDQIQKETAHLAKMADTQANSATMSTTARLQSNVVDLTIQAAKLQQEKAAAEQHAATSDQRVQDLEQELAAAQTELEQIKSLRSVMIDFIIEAVSSTNTTPAEKDDTRTTLNHYTLEKLWHEVYLIYEAQEDNLQGVIEREHEGRIALESLTQDNQWLNTVNSTLLEHQLLTGAQLESLKREYTKFQLDISQIFTDAGKSMQEEPTSSDTSIVLASNSAANTLTSEPAAEPMDRNIFLQNLRQAIRVLTHEHQRTTEEYEGLSSTHEHLVQQHEQTEEQLEELKNQLTAAQDEHTRQQTQLTAKKNTIAEELQITQQKLKDKTTELDSATQKVQQLTKSLTAARRETADATANAAKLQQQLQTAQEQLAQTTKEKDSVIETQQARIARQETEIKQLRAELAERDATIAQTHAQIVKLYEDIIAFQLDINHLNPSKETVAQAEAMLKTKQEQPLATLLAELPQTLYNLMEEIESTTESNRQFMEELVKILDQQTSGLNPKEYIASIKEQLAELEKNNANLQQCLKLADQVQNLTDAKNKALQTQLEQLQTAATTFHQTKQDLEEKLQLQEEAFTKQVNERTEELTTLKTALTAAQQGRNDAQLAYTAADAEISELQAQAGQLYVDMYRQFTGAWSQSQRNPFPNNPAFQEIANYLNGATDTIPSQIFQRVDQQHHDQIKHQLTVLRKATNSSTVSVKISSQLATIKNLSYQPFDQDNFGHIVAFVSAVSANKTITEGAIPAAIYDALPEPKHLPLVQALQCINHIFTTKEDDTAVLAKIRETLNLSASFDFSNLIAIRQHFRANQPTTTAEATVDANPAAETVDLQQQAADKFRALEEKFSQKLTEIQQQLEMANKQKLLAQNSTADKQQNIDILTQQLTLQANELRDLRKQLPEAHNASDQQLIELFRMFLGYWQTYNSNPFPKHEAFVKLSDYLIDPSAPKLPHAFFDLFHSDSARAAVEATVYDLVREQAEAKKQEIQDDASTAVTGLRQLLTEVNASAPLTKQNTEHALNYLKALAYYVPEPEQASEHTSFINTVKNQQLKAFFIAAEKIIFNRDNLTLTGEQIQEQILEALDGCSFLESDADAKSILAEVFSIQQEWTHQMRLANRVAEVESLDPLPLDAMTEQHEAHLEFIAELKTKLKKFEQALANDDHQSVAQQPRKASRTEEEKEAEIDRLMEEQLANYPSEFQRLFSPQKAAQTPTRSPASRSFVDEALACLHSAYKEGDRETTDYERLKQAVLDINSGRSAASPQGLIAAIKSALKDTPSDQAKQFATDLLESARKLQSTQTPIRQRPSSAEVAMTDDDTARNLDRDFATMDLDQTVGEFALPFAPGTDSSATTPAHQSSRPRASSVDTAAKSRALSATKSGLLNSPALPARKAQTFFKQLIAGIEGFANLEAFQSKRFDGSP